MRRFICIDRVHHHHDGARLLGLADQCLQAAYFGSKSLVHATHRRVPVQ